MAISKDDCIICLSEEATFVSQECNHKLFCFSCVVEICKSSNIPFNCPLCREKIKYITGKCCGPICNKDDILICNGYGYYPECNECLKYSSIEILPYEERKYLDKKYRDFDEYFKYNLKKTVIHPDDDNIDKLILILLKCETYEKWLNVFKEYFTEFKFFEKTNGYFKMFSISQANKLTESLKNVRNEIHYKIYHIITSLCDSPWDCTRVGGSVCYHGNFGQYPGGVEGFQLLKYNYLDRYITNISQLCCCGH